jgi:hypothetical protein
MQLDTDKDPIFGEDYSTSWGAHIDHNEVKPAKNPPYNLANAAVYAINCGHQPTRAKLAKLQQIIRFKATRGETVLVDIAHL